MNSRFRFLWIRESFDPIGWRKMRLRTMERTAFRGQFEIHNTALPCR
jgi:hypothetical protein